MKKSIVFLFFVPLFLSAGMIPVNVLAELATGTWCGWCPYAYDGLEVMKSRYPASDFVCMRYYNNSGDLSNPEADSRDNYYNVTGYPSCFFNGTVKVTGGGETTADGSRYDPVVSGLLMGETTPFGIEVGLDVGGGKATATATVKLHDGYSGTEPKLWIGLTEDDIGGEITNVTRRIVDAGNATITAEGSEQVFEETFDVEQGWNSGNLHAVAFLQINSTKEILQVGSSYPKPDYHFRLNMAGSRIERIAPSGTFSTSFFVTNVGNLSDEFTVSLDDTGLPSGWSADLVEPVAYSSVTLDPGAKADYMIEVNPNGNSGDGELIIEVSSGNEEEQQIPVHILTNTADYIVIDDDVGADYDEYLAASLDVMGAYYAVWDCSYGAFNLDNLSPTKTPVLIWCTGDDYVTTLNTEDQDLLASYLDAGGKLFLTGQNIGYNLSGPDSDWESKMFYNDYIHANYIHFNSENTSISGVAGDPITNGMSFNIEGGDGANNQDNPSKISPYDASATAIFKYSTGDIAAIRTEAGSYKIVYLAFGFEGIDNASSRNDLLEKALDWLGPASSTGVTEQEQVISSVFEISTIGNGYISASYILPSPRGQLDIYDALGCWITGIELNTAKGEARLNLSGMPTGCYFVQLKSCGNTLSRKVVLLH
ncbi:Omp28-related outer membrane protein [candidate division WOR-3 bacterium]|nr:Omp28-related outer membrane protein [candidate division WOR-3 bacterium]